MMPEFPSLEVQVVTAASEEPVVPVASSHWRKVRSKCVLLLLVLLVVPEVQVVPEEMEVKKVVLMLWAN